MRKAMTSQQSLTTANAALKWPIMLGSMALTLLAFLLPIYAKQLRIDYGRAAAGVRLCPGDPDRQFPALTSGVLKRSLGA
jgi:hypothetical protein